MSTQTVIRKPSVQSLYIEMSIDGTKLSSGTAFVVDTAKGPHLITNRHNVTGRDQNTGHPPLIGKSRLISFIFLLFGGRYMDRTCDFHRVKTPAICHISFKDQQLNRVEKSQSSILVV